MIVWEIKEYRDIPKTITKLPLWIVKEYEAWKELVSLNGPDILRQFPGYHDEKLRGVRDGQRSSRLNRQYRVIYKVDRNVVVVYVLEISPHKY